MTFMYSAYTHTHTGTHITYLIYDFVQCRSMETTRVSLYGVRTIVCCTWYVGYVLPCTLKYALGVPLNAVVEYIERGEKIERNYLDNFY